MDNIGLVKKLKTLIPEAEEIPVPEKWVRGEELQVRVPPERLADAARFLKEELGFDLLGFVTAVDWLKEKTFELVYFPMRSRDPRDRFFLKARVSREGEPSVPSVTPVWDAANWQEREIFDLYGIRFENHPDLRRILLWEGFDGYPLRKDYIHTLDKYDNGEEIGLPRPSSPPAASPPKKP